MLGANGAGKTTLLRAILGLADAEGTFRFDGKDISRLAVAERVRLGIALVPEGRRLFPGIHRRRESSHRRVQSHRSRRNRARHRRDLRVLSDPQAALRPAGAHAVGRRRSDAGDRTGLDGTTSPVAARRTFGRPDAARRFRDIQDDRRHSEEEGRSPFSWSSRTPSGRWRSPTARPSSKWAVSRSPATCRRWRPTTASRKPTWAGEPSPHLLGMASAAGDGHPRTGLALYELTGRRIIFSNLPFGRFLFLCLVSWFLRRNRALDRSSGAVLGAAERSLARELRFPAEHYGG